jgi:uncharacterized repeat protein (TIGR01451 family)
VADQSIKWDVVIAATQGGANIDLEGYKFYDNLSAVGSYIADSFKVGGVSKTPTWGSNILSYEFPNSSISPQTVSFKTAISDDAYYNTVEKTVNNKAQLRTGENSIVKEGSAQVKFTPKWITKTGEASDDASVAEYDPKNRTITWTIIVNHMGATLNQAIITDLLPAGLTLKSATWQVPELPGPWNESTTWGAATSITPNAQGEYSLGNISSPVLLKIVSSVPDEDYETAITTYNNSAKLSWTGGPSGGLGSGSIGVGIGYNAINKSGVADPKNRKVTWTVKVDTKKQNIPNLKVYDLLVYGNSSSGFNIAQATGFPTGINPADLTIRYDQKYLTGTFAGTGLTCTVHPITQGGKVVADLLEITGFSTTVPNTFTFESQVLNPAIFIRDLNF